MKIFFLIEQLNRYAGTERIAVEVANALHDATLWDIVFVVLDDDVSASFPLTADIRIVSVHGKKAGLLATGLRLRELVRQEKPSYVINVAVPMSRISLIATAFTTTKIITWEHFNLFAGSRMGYMWRLCSALLSNRTVVLTNRDRKSYPKVLQRKVFTIYNFPADMGGRQSRLDSTMAIAVGRLNYQKGFDLLLQVWKRVAEKNNRWKLAIIGSGEDESSLKALSVQLGIDSRVDFIPATSAVADCYEKASLYLMTSRFEGLPLVLIEAKQMGLPCVSFDCPNGPDEIIRTSIDGEIVPDFDEEKMSRVVLSLISDRDRIRKYGEEAKRDVQNRFSKEKIIGDWINLIRG